MKRVAAVLGLVGVVVAACGGEQAAAPSSKPLAPASIPPLERSLAGGPCAGLDYCACTANAACAPRFTEGCVCSCDFRCSAADPACLCACGGAKFAACEPAAR